MEKDTIIGIICAAVIVTIVVMFVVAVATCSPGTAKVVPFTYETVDHHSPREIESTFRWNNDNSASHDTVYHYICKAVSLEDKTVSYAVVPQGVASVIHLNDTVWLDAQTHEISAKPPSCRNSTVDGVYVYKAILK